MGPNLTRNKMENTVVWQIEKGSIVKAVKDKAGNLEWYFIGPQALRFKAIFDGFIKKEMDALIKKCNNNMQDVLAHIDVIRISTLDKFHKRMD